MEDLKFNVKCEEKLLKEELNLIYWSEDESQITHADDDSSDTSKLSINQHQLYASTSTNSSIEEDGTVRGEFTEESDLIVNSETHTQNVYIKNEYGGNFFKENITGHFQGQYVGENNCICGSKFLAISEFISHMKTHTNEKPFKCGICGAKFAVENYLSRHNKIHTGERDVFGAKLNDKGVLVKHTQETNAVCNICGDRFLTDNTLIVHLKTHCTEKNFVCEVCSLRFTTKSDLFRHRRVHIGEKRFVCDVCGFRFTWKTSLVRHVKIHTGEKDFVCDICDYKTYRKGDLVNHMRRHTGEDFACHICDHKTCRKSDLVNHMKRHSANEIYEQKEFYLL